MVHESAGATQAQHAHPEVVEVMRDVGIDLSERPTERAAVGYALMAFAAGCLGCGSRPIWK
jgi:hypothetical protein